MFVLVVVDYVEIYFVMKLRRMVNLVIRVVAVIYISTEGIFAW